MTGLAEVLVVTGVLSAGVVYGTDVFFAVVGRPALEEAREESVTDVMGRLHRYGDARMPVFGALGLASTLGLVFASGTGSTASGWALVALAGLGTQLAAYLTVAKPVNTALTAAAAQGHWNLASRPLQRRWDSVIVPRALGLAVALAGLTLAALSLR
ncbi:hypothetical protein DAETH_38300 (plasmid) [Deinococcus aetherius]|uniref:DUF1772 domain-containing protein n=1 Tax=Deinococcus aetherius TaxID=200252 RepID=A0ABM8AJ79_9DEIO|nr:DUF1772 domain-containing protein [Deinococcus aetherius]BDP43861.1 hypothetical protein DAETH_38300 [Deinococcus aetherius]